MAIIDHLGISVLDLARSTAQFDAVLQALGFVRTDADGSVAWWREGEPELILFPVREGAEPDPHRHGRAGWQHLAFAVDTPAEVDRLHAIATSAGWSVVRDPKHYPRFNDRYYASFVEDASGVRVEFMYNPQPDPTPPAPPAGTLHHVELRTRDLAAATATWGWLLHELGYALFQEWPDGRRRLRGDTYVVLETAPEDGAHDRRMPGLSHLAFHAGSRDEVDRLWQLAPHHGWARLYEDRHPYAGGAGHYAAFLENEERFKVELVAPEAVE